MTSATASNRYVKVFSLPALPGCIWKNCASARQQQQSSRLIANSGPSQSSRCLASCAHPDCHTHLACSQNLQALSNRRVRAARRGR
eukprot:278994-Chlamydomonas_euryale.AAC.4